MNKQTQEKIPKYNCSLESVVLTQYDQLSIPLDTPLLDIFFRSPVKQWRQQQMPMKFLNAAIVNKVLKCIPWDIRVVNRVG
jgi:hypothetical protein